MELTIAGGCGEHGRNCFYIENAAVSLLLDCGIIAGSIHPYPRLSDDQIKRCGWLFLSHSHLDHTGAYPWLVERGFRGRVVLTAETARQLPFAVNNPVFIDKLTPATAEYRLSAALAVTWGKSGHCAGSCWYRFQIEDKTLLYSGDYIEDTLVYACDPIRGQNADLAILDAAYGHSPETPPECRAQLVKAVKRLLARGCPILFPVPQHGRGLELLLLFRRSFPEITLYADEHLRKELRRLDEIAEWVKPLVIPELRALSSVAAAEKISAKALTFISDPQLKQLRSREAARRIAAAGGAVILTGNADKGGHSDELLQSGAARFIRYPVHMNDRAKTALAQRGSFGAVIPFHHGIPR